jgi:hypothetical protein
LLILLSSHASDIGSSDPDYRLPTLATHGNTVLDPEFVEAHNSLMRRRADAAIKQASAVLGADHIPHSCKLLEGTPVSAAIAEEAIVGGYGFIAMSSRGPGMQKDSLRYMGSMTEHMVADKSATAYV